MSLQSCLNSFFKTIADADPDPDPNIGRTWRDRRGFERRVNKKETIRGADCYIIGTATESRSAAEDRGGDIIKVSDLETEIRLETRQYESHKKMMEDVEREGAANSAREAARTSLDGFEKTLSNLMRGKAIAALTKNVNRNGKVMSIRDVIRECVADGWVVEQSRHSGRILSAPDDRFLSEKILTKIGLDYAAFLISKTGEKP